MHLFVAVWPDETTVARLSSLELSSAPALRLVRPDEWHITLRFLGGVDERLVPGLLDARGSAARTLTGPIHAVLGPGTAWFAGGRVLQVPVTGVDGLAAAVRSATVPVVPDRDAGEVLFVGHLTVARATGAGPDAAARSALAGISCSSSFRVDAVHLVGSPRTPYGPRYVVLGSAPLPAG